MTQTKYPPKIEKLLRERGLLDKSQEEKAKTHREAMLIIETAFTKEERQGLVEAHEALQ